MDPQQELFTALLTAINAKGLTDYNVYDGALPPDLTPYPCVYLADSQMQDDANKTAVFGRVTQTIHVYSNDVRRRGTLSGILLSIKTIARNLERTKSFTWMLSDVSQHILPDTTTSEPLLHGVLELTFKFS